MHLCMLIISIANRLAYCIKSKLRIDLQYGSLHGFYCRQDLCSLKNSSPSRASKLRLTAAGSRSGSPKERKMERWAGRVVLVTGASAGIGYAIAEALAQNGMHVIGCARRSEKIEELAKSFKPASGKGGKITAIKCDLTDEKDILAMFERIQKEFKHVDVQLNNAGVGLPDDLLTGQTDKWRQMLELNVLALSICTREALRLMKEAGIDDGHIININSMLGHRDAPMAFVHFYGSTKHMTVALTKGLNAELRQQKSHIRVTSISPGPVESEFMAVRIANSDQNLADQLKNFSMANQAATLKSKDVADSVLYVLSAPPHVNIRELQIAATEYA